MNRAHFLVLIAALAGCSGGETASADGGADGAVEAAVADGGDGGAADDAGDPHGGLRLPRCEDTEPSGETAFETGVSTLVAVREPTLARLMAPMEAPTANPALETGETLYRGMGFDRWRRGEAWARQRRTDLGGPSAAPTGERRSLAWFVMLADTQLVDDESPVRLASIDNPSAGGAMRAQEAFLPRAMSALNRTLRDTARSERPWQFGVIAGDCTDNAHYNELRWFIGVMDGERGIHVDSGADDDPVPGAGNDPKDPFDAVAFPAPWYFVPGNHDLEVVGINLPGAMNRAQATGSTTATGTRDYTRWWAPPRRGAVVPDMNRRLLDRSDFPMELARTAATPGPIGHGLNTVMSPADGLHYTADVVPGLLRLIALDSSDYTGGSIGLVRRAAVDTFLRPALEQAQRDGVLAMLISHHPTSSMDRRNGEFGGEVADAVEPAEIDQLVARYPNVIGWMVGHDHDLRVRGTRGTDTAHPGFWEIMSGSVADWPSQARAIELVNNGDGTLSIFGTMLEIQPRDCAERRFLRLSMIEHLAAWDSNHMGQLRDRNVELVIPVPPTALDAVNRASAAAPTRIESETTLRGMR